MALVNYTLKIDHKSSFNVSFQLKNSLGIPVDLTGWTAKGQIRSLIESTTKYDLTIAFSVDRTDGLIKVSMTAAQTGLLPVTPSTTYDRKITFFFDLLE